MIEWWWLLMKKEIDQENYIPMLLIICYITLPWDSVSKTIPRCGPLIVDQNS